MGSKQSALKPEEIEEFTELTYLSKHEILHIFSRFRKLKPEAVDAYPLQARIPFSDIASLPELQRNPFADRFGQIFSSQQDGCFSFEDFLDLASVMSEHSPAQLKADWAFKIFDFDDDESIGEDDIKMVVTRMTNSNAEDQKHFTEEEMNKIVHYVLEEADLNKSGTITAQEFRHIMTKSPDFIHNFKIRF